MRGLIFESALFYYHPFLSGCLLKTGNKNSFRLFNRQYKHHLADVSCQQYV